MPGIGRRRSTGAWPRGAGRGGTWTKATRTGAARPAEGPATRAAPGAPPGGRPRGVGASRTGGAGTAGTAGTAGPGRAPRGIALGGLRRGAIAAENPDASLERGMRRHRIFVVLMSVLITLAAAAAVSAGGGLLHETGPRPLTAAEQEQYVRDEIARRWHAWPVGKVFPDDVEYLGLARVRQKAKRVGIAPETSCANGLDRQASEPLVANGCLRLLRATYVDQTATFMITVGVAVLQDEPARQRAAERLPVDDRVGVLPVGFPRTVTEGFGVAQRQRTGWVSTGPYIVFSTAGYTDGRTREAVPPEQSTHSELWPTAQTIAGRIARLLGDPPPVPRCTRGDTC
ncbi:hypothetical protein [Bailinhaonella thermotolerans]|uniref:hypothetical protein n=1 Tax=Bailinhaonella thermotolerans TaxID=1070861 RepID=UPI0011C40A8E|nr:hypothetical protein [Bailinhaonella thermotolerans]